MEILNKIYSSLRHFEETNTLSQETRTDYQRDYDRIIFSSAFRRLQNKTQVFPLPGSVFVHNRLTHSLEVASVGRSLAYEIGNYLVSTYKKDLSEESIIFYKYSLQSVISSACLCHDIGNPAFGHSGEDAIASYFTKNELVLKGYFSEKEWADLVNFEGNANAIRILTQKQTGKISSGLGLTMSTLSAIAKYPCESIAKNKMIHRKKFGFFQSEKSSFLKIAEATLMEKESDNPTIFKRHPFVWITEAADDICYNIIDLEDAHRLGLVETERVVDLLLRVIEDLGISKESTANKLATIQNSNEKVSYLRAKVIGILIQEASRLYTSQFHDVLDHKISAGFYDQIMEKAPSLKELLQLSISKIYNNKSVVQIENAGYNVMYHLLDHFVSPVLRDDQSKVYRMALKLLPDQFKYFDSDYQKVMGIIDYISGMTDNYATDLYRKITGIDMGMSF
jgi:dGTPase